MKRGQFIIFLLIFILSACSVTKRHYRPGFFIQRHSTVDFSSHKEIVDTDSINFKEKFVEKKPQYTTNLIQDHESILDEKIVESAFEITNSKTEKIIITKTLSPIIFKKTNFPILREDKSYDDNSILAQEFAKKSYRCAIFAILFCWTIFGGFILSLIAQSKAKKAIWLNEGINTDVDIKAKKSILISKILLLLYSIGLIVFISVMFILFF